MGNKIVKNDGILWRSISWHKEKISTQCTCTPNMLNSLNGQKWVGSLTKLEHPKLKGLRASIDKIMTELKHTVC